MRYASRANGKLVWGFFFPPLSLIDNFALVTEQRYKPFLRQIHSIGYFIVYLLCVRLVKSECNSTGCLSGWAGAGTDWTSTRWLSRVMGRSVSWQRFGFYSICQKSESVYLRSVHFMWNINFTWKEKKSKELQWMTYWCVCWSHWREGLFCLQFTLKCIKD